MRIILTFFLIHFFSFTFAQVNAPVNIDLHRKLQDLAVTGQTDQMFDVLVKGKLSSIKDAVREAGGTYKHGIKDIASVSIPASTIYRIVNQPDIERIEWHNIEAKLLGDFIRINNNLDSLHRGLGELPQGLNGEGVLVGIIDSGMEWMHPDLQNSDGTTRIKYLWDQLYPASILQNDYGYGHDWDEADINAGNIQHDPFEEPTYGHGNGTAGVAVGNGNAVPGDYIGAAPGADIVHVNIDLGNGWYTKFLDGLDYIFSKADELGQPCVVNSSVGSYRGPHDTRGMEVQMIEYMLEEKPGRVLVQAAGNGGGIRQHLGYEVTQDTVFSWFKVNTTSLGYAYFDLYADKADFDDVYFSIGLRRKADYSLRDVSQFFNLQTDFPELMTVGMDSIKRTLYDYETGDYLGEINIYAELNEGVYEMAYIVYPSNATDYWEFSTTGSGKFDVWSNGTLMGTSSIETPNKVPDADVFPDIERYIFADTLKSIVSSWNCSDKVISVANYSNRTSWEGYDNMTYTQSTPAQHKTPNSSVGPTRTGLQKPDIAASGNFTFALQAIERLEALRNDPTKADRLAPEGWHARWSGTSIAAPVVTGAVACYLQQFPNATYAEVKAGIENSAKVDEHVLHQYGLTPNYGWGYGKIDGFNFVNNAIIAVDVDTPILENIELYNIPNPARHSTRIFYKINDFKYSNIQIQITDALGRIIHTHSSDKNTDILHLNTEKLYAGTYFYSIIIDGNTLQTKKMLLIR